MLFGVRFQWPRPKNPVGFLTSFRHPSPPLPFYFKRMKCEDNTICDHRTKLCSQNLKIGLYSSVRLVRMARIGVALGCPIWGITMRVPIPMGARMKPLRLMTVYYRNNGATAWTVSADFWWTAELCSFTRHCFCSHFNFRPIWFSMVANSKVGER